MKNKIKILKCQANVNILSSVKTTMTLQNTKSELNCLNKNYSKILNEFKNDIIIELPLNISNILLSDWIDVTDICRIDEACCNVKTRKLLNNILKNILTYGLEKFNNDKKVDLHIEQKHKIYKYKPSNLNSIDVYLIFKKNEDGEFIDFFDNTYDSLNENKLYRIAELYVGDVIGNKEVPIPFLKEENNDHAFFPIIKNEVRDIEGNIINDETVVELIYTDDLNVPHQYRWKILKTRWDKTESVLRDNKRYGNFKENAIKIWKSMKEKVNIEEIKNLSDKYESQLNDLISRDNVTKDNKYYDKITDLGNIFRSFHNWIKSCIIYNYSQLNKKRY